MARAKVREQTAVAEPVSDVVNAAASELATNPLPVEAAITAQEVENANALDETDDKDDKDDNEDGDEEADFPLPAALKAFYKDISDEVRDCCEAERKQIRLGRREQHRQETLHFIAIRDALVRERRYLSDWCVAAGEDYRSIAQRIERREAKERRLADTQVSNELAAAVAAALAAKGNSSNAPRESEQDEAADGAAPDGSEEQEINYDDLGKPSTPANTNAGQPVPPPAPPPHPAGVSTKVILNCATAEQKTRMLRNAHIAMEKGKIDSREDAVDIALALLVEALSSMSATPITPNTTVTTGQE